MFQALDRWRKTTTRRRASRHGRRPQLETLETRCVLSFLGSEALVNSPSALNNEEQTDNASSANGTSVAVWVHIFNASDYDIYAQRYDKYGQEVGPAIAVDTDTAFSQDPHVAMDAAGNFAVSWTNNNADGTASILMRYYNAAGSPITAITTVASGGQNTDSDVAASKGSLVIAYLHLKPSSPSVDDDVYAARYVITNGTPVFQGTIDVNTDTNDETNPSVAMAPSGAFDIAYDRRFSGSDYDIYAAQYRSTGALVRGVAINADGLEEVDPSVAMDNKGNAVITYTQFSSSNDQGVYANRLTAGGSVSSPITVQDASGVTEDESSVALSPVTGQFVVSYSTSTASSGGIGVAEMSAGNTPLASLGPVPGFDAAISIDGLDRYLVTYHRFNAATNGSDVFSRRDLLTG